jgi:PKD repeat protein
MKLLKACFYILLLLCISPIQSLAGSILGGEISYVCLGNYKYEVHMKIYSDCNDTTLSNYPLTVIPHGCSTTGFNKTLKLHSITDITPLCSSVYSVCAGSSATVYGINEYYYRDTIDLGSFSSCCKFRLNYEVTGGWATSLKCESGTDFITEVMLDKCVSPCNNSPAILNLPPMIVCASQDLCFNYGFRDTADGDSLSFKLVEALFNGATNWPPITACIPAFLGSPNMNGNLPAGFHVDPNSGDVCFRPVTPEVANISIEVTEWRNIGGTITNIGVSRKEMALIIKTCSNNKVPNILGPYSYEACSGSKLCFNMVSTDLDAADSVRLSWDNAIPGATFTTAWSSTNSKKEVGTFCWTPSAGDVSNNPYYFTVTAQDNSCPVNSKTRKSYSVTVHPTPAATTKLTKEKCGRVAMKISPIDFIYHSTFHWQIKKDSIIVASYSDTQDSANHKFSSPGTYVVRSQIRTQRNCSSAFYYDTIVVDTFLVLQLPSDTVVCNGNSLQIISDAAKGTAPYRYLWSSSVNDTLPDLNTTVNGNAMYSLMVTDALNCSATDSINVISRVPAVSAGNDNAVCPTSGLQTLNGTPSGGSWSGPGVYANFFDPVLAGTGSHQLQYFYTDSTGCSNKDSMIMTVSPSLFVSAGSDTSVCPGDTLQLMGFPQNGTWSGTGVTGNLFSSAAAGTYTLAYSYTAGSGCSNSDTMQVTVDPLPVVNAGADSAVCENSAAFNLSGSPAGGSWSGAGVSSGMFDPFTATAGTHQLTYSYTDMQGCSNSDPLDYTVHARPNVNAGNDTFICTGSPAFMPVGSPAGGSWSGPGVSANKFDPFSLSGINTIFYNYTDTNGCVNTDSADMIILSPPLVNAGGDRSLCASQAPVTLHGVPAGGTWTGTGMSGTQFSPTVTGAGNFNVIYQVTDSSGCSNADTAMMNVSSPQADFIGSVLVGIAPLTVNFTDLSTGFIQKWEWDFGDTASGVFNTSSLQNPSHVYSQPGFYTVSLKVTDTTLSCSDTAVRQNYLLSLPTGISRVDDAHGILAFPNPASKTFDVLLNTASAGSFALLMYDINGKKVMEMQQLSKGTVHVNCSDLVPGIYQLLLTGESGEMYRSKVVLE